MGGRRTEENPFLAWKVRNGFTYRQVAERLRISLSYAKQLGSEHAYGPSSAMSEQLERRSNGELDFDELMRWALRMRRRRRRAEKRRRETPSRPRAARSGARRRAR